MCNFAHRNNNRRAAAVLIPDSKHITVDTDNRLIQNSDKSKELRRLCMEMESNSPENFHIDVFHKIRRHGKMPGSTRTFAKNKF